MSLDPHWAWSRYEPDARQPFDRAAAAHLFRRAGFSANWSQLQSAVAAGPSASIKQLLAGDPPPAQAKSFQRDLDALTRGTLAGGQPRRLSAWWLYRMIRTPRPLVEKMTLCWHGHFATSAAKVNSARLMYEQNELLRRNALGRFDALVHEISRDPAMLIWLDSRTNRRTRPNENYARELMELFCLGEGNYTERDIKQMARAFTGWEIDRDEFLVNAYQHDTLNKTFLGHTGNFDGDDAVRIVLEQPAAARHIAGRLYRTLVADEPAPDDKLLEPLVERLRQSKWNLADAVEFVLGSQVFFSEYAIGRKVRSPVELGVGLMRALQANTNVVALAEGLGELGQAVFYPPNVKGWDGGRAWINSSTLLGRANLVRRLLTAKETELAAGSLETLAGNCGANTADETVDWLVELLVAVPVAGEVRKQLVKLCDRGPGSRSERIASTIHALSTMPEFQLA